MSVFERGGYTGTTVDERVAITISAGEWFIPASADKPSKFWEVLDRLNELGGSTQ